MPSNLQYRHCLSYIVHEKSGSIAIAQPNLMLLDFRAIQYLVIGVTGSLGCSRRMLPLIYSILKPVPRCLGSDTQVSKLC